MLSIQHDSRPLRFTAILAAAGLLQFTTLARAQTTAVSLRITPQSPTLIGDPLHIVLDGLPPGSRVELNAIGSSQNFRGEARAHFVADAAGSIDLDRDAPVAGSYAGIDPSGLFWSMQPAGSPEKHNDAYLHVLKLSAWIDGECIVDAEHHSYSKHPRVKSTPVREHGLYATFHDPGMGKPRPGIVLIGGSGGGIGWQEFMGGLLASHGYATLSLAYFKSPNLPAMLKDIPLEYFDDAINWFANHDEVDQEHIAVMGYSKGAELALLLGGTNPKISAVVSYSGACAVFQAPRAQQPTSSWSRGGRSLPYVPMVPISNRHSLAEMYLISLANADAVMLASIPVEQTKGAILLLSGESDRSWPATSMSERVMERLQLAGHPYDFSHLAFPRAGHEIHQPGYLPTISGEGHGELRAATARARRDGWAKVLAFLSRSLGDS